MLLEEQAAFKDLVSFGVVTLRLPGVFESCCPVVSIRDFVVSVLITDWLVDVTICRGDSSCSMSTSVTSVRWMEVMVDVDALIALMTAVAGSWRFLGPMSVNIVVLLDFENGNTDAIAIVVPNREIVL